jgi:hypothetical protein
MQTVKVPSRLWYDNQEREIGFPDRWQVDNLTSPGLEKPGLTPEQIRERVFSPWRGRPWRNWPRGRGRPSLSSTT